MPTPQPGAAALPDYTPRELRDFGARIRAHRNESLFALPPSILAAVQSTGDMDLRQYPSDLYDALSRLAAARLNVGAESLFFGNGSDDLIFAIANAYLGSATNAVMVQPTFGMYKRAALLRDAEIREVPYTTRWRIDPAALIAASDEATRVLFLCSPNNPTCELLEPSALERIALCVPQALIVVDEAYLRGADASFFPATARFANVAVIATLSKIPGLAGLRCGFGAADPAVTRVLRRVMQPHPLNITALRAMQGYFTQVLNDAGYQAAYARFVGESLDLIQRELGPLSRGVTRGGTNFIVLEFGPRAQSIAIALERDGILLRLLETPAFDGGLRISALPLSQTQAVIEAVKTALEPAYA